MVIKKQLNSGFKMLYRVKQKNLLLKSYEGYLELTAYNCTVSVVHRNFSLCLEHILRKAWRTIVFLVKASLLRLNYCMEIK